ncbi:MAG: twin-arginine translocase subunit TatC [bacterium]
MSFFDHLEELRRRIFYALIALGVAAVAGWFVSAPLLAFLTGPVDRLVFLAPAEAFTTQLKVALIAGALIAAPVVLYQFWRFVRPALLPREAGSIALAVTFGTLFFFGGFAFAYFAAVPVGLKFLLGFETPKLVPMLSVGRYVSFATGIMLAFGIVFQMPVVLFFLTKLGIVTPRMLWKNQRLAILVIVIAAAIFTPPDVISQMIMAVPMLVLYEVSILGSWLAARGRA